MKSLIARAASLFRRFHGRHAERGELCQLRENDVYLLVGDAIEIRYCVPDKPGIIYRHKFGNRHPLLYVSSDGKTVCMVKGSCRFTDRGFQG